jgi:ribosomal subunit interface protein
MEIKVRSQHGHVPESLQELTAAKMAVLGKFLTTIDRIDVEVDRDGHPNRRAGYLVRVAVATAGPVFRSKVICDDPVAGIDVAVERLSRRLKEFKRRRSGRPLHSKPKTAPVTTAETPLGGSASDADGSGVVDSELGAD